MKKSLLRPEMTATSTTTTTPPSDVIIRTKIENATEGLSSDCFNLLHNRMLPATSENALTICNYISSLRSEINPSDGYRKNNILLLCTYSIFFRSKLFRVIKRNDV